MNARVFVVALSVLVSSLAGCRRPVETIPVLSADDYQSSGTTAQPLDPIDLTKDASESTDGPAVDLQVSDLEGLKAAISDRAGKIVVVDIWSTACLPCMQEFHNLVEIAELHRDQVACISLNVDYLGLPKKAVESYVPKVTEFLNKQNASSVKNLLSSVADSDVFEHFSIESIPAVLIYDAKGELKHQFTDANSGDDGMNYEGDVLPMLRELLQQ